MSKDDFDLLSDEGKEYFSRKWAKDGEFTIPFGQGSQKILNAHFPHSTVDDLKDADVTYTIDLG